jgi:hypothetical protein
MCPSWTIIALGSSFVVLKPETTAIQKLVPPATGFISMLGDIPHQWTDGREEWRGEERSGEEVSHIPFPIVLDDVGALARLIHLNVSTLGIPEPVPRPIKKMMTTSLVV